jgi:competence protein ComEC
MISEPRQADPLPSHAPRYQPLVLMLAAAAGGVVADRCLPVPATGWWLTAVALTFVWLAMVLRRCEHAASWLLLAAFAASGGAWHHHHWRLYGAAEIGRAFSEHAQPLCLEGIAQSSPRWIPAPPQTALRAIPKGESSELVLRVTAARDGHSWRAASGLAQLDVEGRLLGVNAGDRVRVMALANRPSPPLNPGEFDFASFERSRRVLCRLRGQFPRSVTVVERGSRWTLRRWLSDVRQSGSILLWRRITPQRATLASAILLGAREQLDPERNEGYLVTGTIHVLSISGLHVGILAAGFLALLRTGLLPRRLTLIAAMLLAGVYALLTDAQPPVVRAAILIGAACTAQLWGRRTSGYNALAAAGLVVLVHNPLSLFLAGTQLSFLAVATMILAWPILSPAPITDPLDRLIAATRPWPEQVARGVGRWLWRAWLTGALIWLTSMPLVWLHYGLISPSALILNLVISIPIMLALYLGFGVLLLGWLVPPLAALCGWGCDLSLALIESSIEVAAAMPGSYFWLAPPPGYWVVMFYVGLATVAIVPRIRRSLVWPTAGLVMWVLVAAPLAVPPRPLMATAHQQPLVCTFVAVGHGTAALLELPDGRTMLYDCGRLGSPTFTSRQIASVLWSRGITHLDAVVVSHADSDHFNALPGLLERFSVGVIYVSPVMFDEGQPAVIELRRAIDESGVPLRELRASQPLDAGSEVQIEVLHPPGEGVLGSDNANSLVLLIEHAGRRLLLPGDLESPGLEDLLAEEPIDCDVIMAPHHGSPRSDPTGFALWSRPEFVVVSGGHEAESRSPAEVVKESYRARGATVLHTAETGAVRVELSAEGVRVRTHRQVVSGEW